MSTIQGQITKEGAIADLTVCRSQAAIETIRFSPMYRTIRGLIDTGATITCVDLRVIEELGLTCVGEVDVRAFSAGGGIHPRRQFDAMVCLDGPHSHFLVRQIPILEGDFSEYGYQALVGRDILDHFMLFYNGRLGEFTISQMA